MQTGEAIGDWVVEEPLEGDSWRCHRADAPFRKAILKRIRGPDTALLLAEARSLARVRHPSVQGVLAVETSGDELWVVHEAASGTPLSAFVRQPPLPLKAAFEIAAQLTDALASAHDLGVHHRGLTPDAILLTPEGRVLLLGFNLRSSVDTLSPDGPYAAPEARRSGADGARIDAFALGVVLAELFTGTRTPTRLEDPLRPPPPVPADLAELIARLTDPDPDARPDLRHVGHALAAASRGSLPDRTTAEATFSESPLADDVPLWEGQRIGRYRIVREIGRGGVGVVYEAVDSDLHRKVAIKVLISGQLARAREVERFLREARAVARLDHPGLVKILEMGRGPQGAWFAMDFVEGPTLLELVRRHERLPWARAAQLARDVARALHHAHEHGLVHRDVKPNNVIVEAGDVPRLTDFGLALESNEAAERLTRTGQVLGTPMYMSPEQARGDLAALGPHTDVYALGVVLYEMLCGRVPYEGPTPLDVITKVLTGDPVSPRSHVPTLPASIELVCLKAMRRDPRDRYPSAAAFADDLQRALTGEPVEASSPTLSARLRWFVRRHRTALAAASVAVAGAAVAAALSLGGASAWALRADRQREALAAERLETTERRLAELHARGAKVEASEAWRAYAGAAEHRRTSALVRGWLHRAEELRSDGQVEAAKSAFANAYAEADAQDEQESALLGLARLLRARHEVDALAPLVRSIRSDLARTPELRELARAAYAARLDLGAAARFGAGAAGDAVLAALAHATRTEQRATWARRYGDQMMLRLERTGEGVLADAEPTLPLVRRVQLPFVSAGGYAEALLGEPGRPLLLSRARGGLALVEERDGELAVAAEWDHSRLQTAVSGDVDGDGRVEHYYSADRSLFRLDRDSGGAWRRTVPHPGSNALNSDLVALAVGDLDGDGADDLVVAAGEWGAYDVRVLGPARPGGPLALKGRIKLGAVRGIALVDVGGRLAVLATKEDVYPSRRVFPPDQPYGVPRGVYRLGWDGAAWTHERVGTANTCGDLLAGDLDGDGRPDVVAVCADRALLLAQTAAGGFEEIVLPTVFPRWMGDLDGDGDAELVAAVGARDAPLWVLGSGAERLPVRELPSDRSTPPPAEADEAFRGAWARAEDLARIGRTVDAAAAHRALAEIAWGTDAGGSALRRSAELREVANQWDEALNTWQAALDGSDPAVALRGSARAARRKHDLEAERAALAGLGDRGLATPDESARLAVLAKVEPVTAEITFAALDPRWRIEDPSALRLDGYGALRVRAMAGRTLARLPVTWSGEWLDLRVDASVPAPEWDSELQVGLVPAGTDEPFYGIALFGHGGGGIVHTTPGCLASLDAGLSYYQRDDQPMDLEMQVLPDGEGMRCRIQQGDETLDRVVPMPAVPSHPAWELVLRTVRTGTLSEATVRAIRLDGAAVVGEPDRSDDARARRALVAGETGLAFASLGPSPDPETRLALAIERGETDVVAALLVPRLDTPEGQSAVADLIHASPEIARLALAEPLGRRWPFWFFEAWQTTLSAHRREPRAAAALAAVGDVAGVEPQTGRERLALSTLLAMQGELAIDRADFGEAERLLRRALALAEVDDTSEAGRYLRLTLPVTVADLALAKLGLGDVAGAVAQVEHALATSDAPEITADILYADPAFAPLMALPEVARAVAARRGTAP